jgi:hypothetical protein
MTTKQNRVQRAVSILILSPLLLILPACSPEQVPKPDEADSAETSGEGWTLIADGEARGVIYLAGEATPTATYAAEELRDHLQLVTGVEVPIVREMPEDEATPVVLVGPSAAAAARGVDTEDLSPAGFRIRSGDNWLVLLGDDGADPPFSSKVLTGSRGVVVRNGTLMAVYDFLEKVAGIRWYMPGELGTVAPPAETIDIPPLDMTFRSPLKIRNHQIIQGKAFKALPEGDALREADGGEVGRWYLRSRFGREESVTLCHTFNYLSELRPYARERRLNTTKPEIYAVLPDGSRDFNTTSYGHGNLCLSEPETLRLFVDMVRQRFDQNPDLKEFSVNPNDVWIPCHCEKCLSAIDPALREEIRAAGLVQERGTARLAPEHRDRFREESGRLVAKFHVAVAREIHQSHPDRLVGAFGGYEGYGNPGNYADLGPLPPNLAFQVTKTRSRFWDKEYQESVHFLLRQLREITPHIYAWEYYLWRGRPWNQRPMMPGYPVFFPTVLAEDMAVMNEVGLRGEYANSWGLMTVSPGLDHPMAYLTARMLYDPDLDLSALLEEYYTNFYGAARDEMKAFWEHAERCWMRDTRGMDARAEADKIIETLFPPADLAILFGHLEAGMDLVPLDSAEHRRIALIAEEMAPVRSRLQPVESLGTPPQFQSATLFPAPEILGTFQDGWSGSAITLRGPDGQAASPATQVLVGHDPQNLYLTFRAEEDGSAPLPSEADGQSWLWGGVGGRSLPRNSSNTLMIEIQPDPAVDRSVAILINASGAYLDLLHGDPAVENPRQWQSKARVAVAVDDKGWSGTVAIPWSSLGVNLHASLALRANITRVRSGQANSAWSPLPPTWNAATAADRGRERFGTLHFLED